MTAVPATLRLRREGVLRSRAARGDAQAFAAVYDRHHQALYRYCRSILHHEEDAQDALQSTMTRAFAALQDEQRDFELRPWLFRIAHNEAVAILRRRREAALPDDAAGHDSEVEDRVAEREELRELRRDLADLPERQHAALVLRELNGLSHAEIGEVLELTPAAVKQSIFEARSALFSCREGRDMACQDVRRMLSDGDGRVLRGRGVRAHLRSCPDCRRFRADLDQRPQALRILAPPLPVGTAAALLAQLVGGGTAAKLLACVAIAGGGTTLAVEMRDAREPARPAVAERAKPAPRSPKPASVVPAATSVPRESAAAEQRAAEPRARKRAKPVPRKRAPKERVALVTAPAPEAEAAPVVTRRAERKPPKRAKAEKPAKPEKRAKKEKPAKPARPVKVAEPVADKPDKAAKRRAQAAPEARGGDEDDEDDDDEDDDD